MSSAFRASGKYVVIRSNFQPTFGGDFPLTGTSIHCRHGLLLKMATQLKIAERRKLAEQLRIAGKTYDQIAAELGVSPHTARNDCIAVAKGPTDKELAIRKLKADGLTYDDIAEILGVSPQTIAEKIRIRNSRPDPSAPCSKCGEIANEIACHHLNYITDEWVALCRSCHAKVHCDQVETPKRLWARKSDEQGQPIKVVRGFAAMTPEKRQQVAAMGGRTVSANREHMQNIGRKGGKSSWNSVAQIVSNDSVTDASKTIGDSSKDFCGQRP